MAKKMTTEKEEKSSRGKRSPDLDVYVENTERWQNEDEWQIAKNVIDRLEKMSISRQSSCYWGEGSGEIKGWVDRWSRDEKLAIMWRGDMGDDDNLTNLKSPISWGAIQAIMAEFEDGKIETRVRENEEGDKEKARILEAAFNYADKKNDFNLEYSDGFHRFVEKGTVVFYNGYMKRSYKAEFYKTDAKKMSEDEKKKVKNKKPVTETKDVVDYDDIVTIPIRIEEFYIDENARCLHGKSFEAVDCIWRTPMTPSQIRQEFENNNDPYVIKENLDKVKCASAYVDDDSFFSPPEDLEAGQSEVVRYYNKYRDQYIVVANDVVIRDGPNPHIHKQLPFTMKACFPFLDHPYGISIPAILEGLQSEDEVIRNSYLQQLLQILQPPQLINRRIYSEFTAIYERTEPNMQIPVNASDDVTWMSRSHPVYEVNSALAQIREDAVVASGVDPRKQGLSVKNATATDAMLNKEATMKLLKKLLKRYVEVLQESKRQLYAEMRQHYTVPRLQEITDNDETRSEKIYRKVRMEGFKLTEDDDGKMKEEKIPGYSWFALKKEHFDFKQDPDIFIDPEAIVSVSKGLEMQKSEQALADLLPLSGDPTNLQPGQPMPIIDIRELVKGYIETHNLSNRLMVEDDFDEDKAIDRAIDQNSDMREGKHSMGIPGEPVIHKMVHQAELQSVNNILKSPPNSMMMSELQILMMYQQLLAQHLIVDDTPRSMTTQALTAGAMPQQPQGGPQGSGPTQGPAGGMARQPGSPNPGVTQQSVYGEAKPQPQINPVV